ncbi:copper resistance CopC family protein [Halobacillus sp. B23F22_1]|uniref:copper resistance CopC family protein n=1 Tax=Halobacillus sp. B23F22_1 TaxID=3459514 RepID=UPI00373EBE46
MKYISIVFLAFMFAYPLSAGAHTHLENSDPEAGEQVPGDDPVITLIFDSPVQQPNEITVTDESGNEITVEDVNHSSDEVIEVPLPEELESGEIEVFYSIVGEDGHVMEEEFSFSYEEVEQDAEENEETAESESEESAEEETLGAAEENSSNSWLMPVLAVSLLAVAALVFVFTRKKS